MSHSRGAAWESRWPYHLPCTLEFHCHSYLCQCGLKRDIKDLLMYAQDSWSFLRDDQLLAIYRILMKTGIKTKLPYRIHRRQGFPIRVRLTIIWSVFPPVLEKFKVCPTIWIHKTFYGLTLSPALRDSELLPGIPCLLNEESTSGQTKPMMCETWAYLDISFETFRNSHWSAWGHVELEDELSRPPWGPMNLLLTCRHGRRRCALHYEVARPFRLSYVIYYERKSCARAAAAALNPILYRTSFKLTATCILS